METKEKWSFIYGVPSGALAVMTFVFSTLILFLIGESIDIWLAYIITAIMIAIACFFICRSFPVSFWYVPLICNALGLMAAFIEPNFWITSLWKQNMLQWVLSVSASVFGAWLGRHNLAKVSQ